MTTKKYETAVKNILKSSQEAALEHIRDLRDEEQISSSQILEQKLLSFRIAIKSGQGSMLNEEEIYPDAATTRFLRAEAHFVRSLVLMHQRKLQSAGENFMKAAVLYAEEGLHEKALLSRFNGLIAQCNSTDLSAQDELHGFNEVLVSARELKIPKVMGLCLRQKSYIYFSTARFRAALQEVMEALPLIEAHCPVSDHNLTLIHATDCAFELQDLRQAQIFLDYLPHEIDSRLAFPLAYVKAKMGDRTLDLSHFEDINSHWQKRYQAYLENTQPPKSMNPRVRWRWDSNSHWIMSENKKLLAKIRPQSLEGQLLKILMRGPHSKELLCEILWPTYSPTENLDDRFFRLKTRFQQKLGRCINFDGQKYSLSVTVHWRQK